MILDSTNRRASARQLQRRRLARKLDALALLLQALLALSVLVMSGIFLSVVFAFASLDTADLSGWSWWADVLWRMFRFPDAGLGTWPALILLVTALIVMIRSAWSWGRLRIADRVGRTPVNGKPVSSSS
jgi:hypothetical protein